MVRDPVSFVMLSRARSPVMVLEGISRVHAQRGGVIDTRRRINIRVSEAGLCLPAGDRKAPLSPTGMP